MRHEKREGAVMRSVKKESRREQILSCAARIFAKKGYHATSISDICKKSDVARGTIYLYFKNKRDIFDTLIKNFTGDIFRRISVFTPGEALQPQFNRNMCAVVDIITQNKDLTKIMVSEAVGLDAEFDHQLILFYARLVEYVEGALTMLQKNGDISKHVNVRLLAYALVGAIKEIAYQWALDGGNVLDMDPLIKTVRQFNIQNFIAFTGES